MKTAVASEPEPRAERHTPHCANASDLAVCRRVQNGVDSGELRTIEHVVSGEPQFQRARVLSQQRLAHRHVEDKLPRPANTVSLRIPELTRRRSHKGRGIEPAVNGSQRKAVGTGPYRRISDYIQA